MEKSDAYTPLRRVAGHFVLFEGAVHRMAIVALRGGVVESIAVLCEHIDRMANVEFYGGLLVAEIAGGWEASLRELRAEQRVIEVQELLGVGDVKIGCEGVVVMQGVDWRTMTLGDDVTVQRII